jgi:hypothetical protein
LIQYIVVAAHNVIEEICLGGIVIYDAPAGKVADCSGAIVQNPIKKWPRRWHFTRGKASHSERIARINTVDRRRLVCPRIAYRRLS